MTPTTQAWKAQLKEVQKAFIIVEMDKSPQTLVACCRKVYYDNLEKIATQFTQVTDEQKEVHVQTLLKAHETIGPLKRDNIEDKRIPYMYLTPKLHKKTLAFRIIVGSPFNDKIKQTTNYTRTPAKTLKPNLCKSTSRVAIHECATVEKCQLC